MRSGPPRRPAPADPSLPASGVPVGQQGRSWAKPAGDGLPILLTCKQAGEYTGLGDRYMRRLINERRIDFVRIGRLVRFERAVLDAYIAAHRVPMQRDDEVS